MIWTGLETGLAPLTTSAPKGSTTDGVPWAGVGEAEPDAPAEQPVPARDPERASDVANAGGGDQAPATRSPRERLARLAASLDEARQHIPELTAALRDEDGVVRLRAAELLARLGDPGISVLLAQLRTDHENARLAAAFGLARTIDQLGSEALQKHAPLLAEVLSGWLVQDDPATRSHGAEALGRLGQWARGAVPALVAALDDEAWDVRMVAARSLGQIGGGAEIATALAAMLDDASESVRRESIESIGRLGAAGSPAVPALLEALSESAFDLRLASLLPQRFE